MYRGTWKGILLLSAAAILLSPLMFSQEPKKEGKTKTKTIELRIQVTGGEESMPVKGATVYIEWQEERTTKSRQGTTNSKGIAGPYPVPWGKVFIQVTTEEDEWGPFGHDYDLKNEDQPIKINLRRRGH